MYIKKVGKYYKVFVGDKMILHLGTVEKIVEVFTKHKEDKKIGTLPKE